MSHSTRDDIFPQWYHRHGCKIELGNMVMDPPSVTLESSAASLVVSLMPNVPGDTRRLWKIEWSIIHGLMPTGKVRGELTQVTDSQLKAAFGIIENPKTESHSRWLLDRYGGDWALQGFAIRQGCHLNIPCPGTGNDGDPNISICIDDDVKATIVKLFSFLAV